MSVEFQFIPVVLPMAPRPMSDELLPSWLHRVATANALSFGELLESARAGRLPGLVGVMDHGLPTAWRTRLATFCRIPESRIRLIDLQSQFPNRNLSWFTHARAFHGSSGEPSIQLGRPFCVPCGEERRERYKPAYIRADWALAFRTHCPHHLSPLIDGCGACGRMTFPRWSGTQFCCQGCEAPLKPTHTLSDSPGLRAVVRLQNTIHGCFLGRPPELHWLGSLSGNRFLQVIFELIDILTHRTGEPRLVLTDLLVPDEFRRAYNLGGRFDHPQFSTLPWFPRFLVLAALNRLLLAFSAPPLQSSAVVATVDHVLNHFFCLLPIEQRITILDRTEKWPSSLGLAFRRAATMVKQRSGRRHHAVQRLGTILGSGPRGIPLVKCNTLTL
jgi:TniQ